ncbi:hypothetical protein MTO96_003948 [Rhipicephalus appendiculatus]
MRSIWPTCTVGAPPREQPKLGSMSCAAFLVMSRLMPSGASFWRCWFTVVIVTIISVNTAKDPDRTSHALVADPDVDATCSDDSAICHNITLYLMESLNSLVDPCSDFYENVCGWWKAKVAHQGPYHDFHVRFFNHRVARELAA